MWIFGIILCAVGAGLLYASRRKKKRLEALESAHASTVEFLADLANSLSSDHGGPGHLVYQARISGSVECDSPLKSTLGGKSCVYHEHSVVREYEEDDRKPDGSVDSTKRSETLESDSQVVPFFLNDGTGRILVEPDDASITASKTLSRYEPHSDRFGAEFDFGFGRISIGLPGSSGRRTLGYRITEKTIEIGQSVFVSGEVTDKGGTLRLRKPAGDIPFVVSTQSEEKVLQSARSGAKWFGIWGIVVLVAGILLVLFG